MVENCATPCHGSQYLPVEKAQDAAPFMLSFQYWLGERGHLPNCC